MRIFSARYDSSNNYNMCPNEITKLNLFCTAHSRSLMKRNWTALSISGMHKDHESRFEPPVLQLAYAIFFSWWRFIRHCQPFVRSYFEIFRAAIHMDRNLQYCVEQRRFVNGVVPESPLYSFTIFASQRSLWPLLPLFCRCAATRRSSKPALDHYYAWKGIHIRICSPAHLLSHKCNQNLDRVPISC